MFNQSATEILMAVPKNLIEPYRQGLVQLNSGVLRHAVGGEKGQIAGHLIPVGPEELVHQAISGELVAIAATQFAVVGLIAVSFYKLNKKLDEVGESIRRLESKFDDQRWALLAGAIDQLRRIEREGANSGIWNDLAGVRKELSSASAYHWRRAQPLLDPLSSEYSKFEVEKFLETSRQAISELVALSIARASLGRALFMEGALESAHIEMQQAKEEVEFGTSALANGLINYVVKKHSGWLRSTEHKLLIKKVEGLIETQGAIRALEVLSEELNRPVAWYDNSLSVGIRTAWKELKLNDDANFIINFDNESKARELSYKLSLEQNLTSDSYIDFVANGQVKAA